ncbi:Probable ubiquitin-conjugating enzyme E2 R521 (E2 ubiquitin-conjugating enzyme R521) (Ubiquitin carrier protein) (Ubiquitin-protein ligase) [Durusdinium trenchii]|uniref:Probable ubiquitin-conjugating enzyme E2 R521 (E2 ubiquitin-conjugating enzyme R521) (Ubiquitin carrier protein) (Ubiquitin-protein ligase) n=1 Tax=Durusdinium trenchii TaxID=1381693 RepID=A0ABP0QWB0_9DINO
MLATSKVTTASWPPSSRRPPLHRHAPRAEFAGLASMLPLNASSAALSHAHDRSCPWRHQTGLRSRLEPHQPSGLAPAAPGRDTVCFNPNLYSNGKVCLSLLGTWQGETAEQWDSQTSRAVQVLISIQSLILVSQPYFNEPGFEREIGTEPGERRSREYNRSVKENCIRWAMIDVLKNPKKDGRGDGDGASFQASGGGD